MAPGGAHKVPQDGIEPSPDEQALKLQCARAVLADAGWLFDDFVNAEMRKVLASDPDDMTTREIAYNRARVATELKAGLAALVAEHEANARVKKRRDLLKESLYGRRD